MPHADLVLRKQELIMNPSARVPVALCLDASGSMSGKPIAELNAGVAQFLGALRDDPIAESSAEVAVIAFSSIAQLCSDFTGLGQIAESPTLKASGGTSLGEGVLMAIDALDRRKKEYQSVGVDYYQPFLVLMTDGQPTTAVHVQAAQQVRDLEGHDKLVVFPIAIGSNADLSVLASFSAKRAPLRLKGLSFSAFFIWLSKSVSRVSQSRPGEKVSLDVEGIKGWAEI